MKSCCLSPPRKIRFLNLLWVLLVCGISKWLKNACLFVYHLVKENWKNICVYGCLPIILYKCCVSVSPFVSASFFSLLCSQCLLCCPFLFLFPLVSIPAEVFILVSFIYCLSSVYLFSLIFLSLVFLFSPFILSYLLCLPIV